MRAPPREEIVKLFESWSDDILAPYSNEECFVCGYMLCWKQFEEFVKSEIGGESHESK